MSVVNLGRASLKSLERKQSTTQSRAAESRPKTEAAAEQDVSAKPDHLSDGWMCQPGQGYMLPDPDEELWTVSRHHVDGVSDAENLPSELREQWREETGLDMSEYLRRLFDHTGLYLGEMSLAAESSEGCLALATLKMSLRQRGTNEAIGSLDRIFNFTPVDGPEVEHGPFDLDASARGQGYGQAILASSVALYRRMGITKVSVNASEEGEAGLAWAKFGARPAGRRGAEELAAAVRERLHQLRLPRHTVDKVEQILNRGEPEFVWELADLDEAQSGPERKVSPLSSLLLSGLSWHGVLDLENVATMERLNRFLPPVDVIDPVQSERAIHDDLLAEGRTRVPNESAERLIQAGLNLEQAMRLLHCAPG